MQLAVLRSTDSVDWFDRGVSRLLRVERSWPEQGEGWRSPRLQLTGQAWPWAVGHVAKPANMGSSLALLAWSAALRGLCVFGRPTQPRDNAGISRLRACSVICVQLVPGPFGSCRMCPRVCDTSCFARGGLHCPRSASNSLKF